MKNLNCSTAAAAAFFVVCIFVFAASVAAQGTGLDGVTTMTPAELKRFEKQRVKRERENTEQARRYITVDFAKLINFPNDFVGGTQRVYRAVISEIEPLSVGRITVYPFKVSVGNDYTMNFPLPNRVVFIMDEQLARQVTEQISSTRRNGPYGAGFNPVADVYFELAKADSPAGPYFAARVSCVAILLFASRRLPFGKCDYVQ